MEDDDYEDEDGIYDYEEYEEDFEDEGLEMTTNLKYPAAKKQTYDSKTTMFNPATHSDVFVHGMMHRLNGELIGTNFSLAMRDKYGSLGVYPRVYMPCQGGEIRKYTDKNPNDKRAVAHGDACTRPESEKPTDLYAPFPSGVPELFGHRMSVGGESHQDAIRFLFSDESPWKKGFGSGGAVEFTEDDKGNIVGVVLLDMAIDPTVLVNLLWIYKDCANKNYQTYLDAGMTRHEAVMSIMMGGYSNILQSALLQNNTYHYAQHLSVPRFMNADPNDLTGGTFRDGFDYNRKLINEIFEEKEEGKGVIFGRDLPGFVKKEGEWNAKNVVKGLRNMIESEMSK